MARRKKKAEVVCIYPGLFFGTSLPTDRSWTIFHREVSDKLEHSTVDEHCWCNPICVPTEGLGGEVTTEEYKSIVYSPIH